MGERDPSHLVKVTLIHSVRGERTGWEAGAG